MRKLLAILAGATVLTAPASALNLYLKKTVDLGATGLDVFGGTSGNDAGFNPSALATDGSTAWIVGWNGTNAAAKVGMVRLLNAFGASPTIQLVTNATITTAPSLRGYQGVVFDPATDTAIATYDPGSSSAQGLSGYGAFDGAIKYQNALRGSGNGAMDPGFASADQGYADVQFSSGRRWLYNAGAGTNIYNGSTGFVFYPGVGSTLCRSIAFASNGDAFVRAANDIYKGTRSGGNSTSAQTLFVDRTDAPFVAGQNIAVGALGGATEFVFFNDRPVTSTQPLATVLQSVRASDATPEPLSFFNATGSGGTGIVDGNGYYDIDAVGNKLYVLDFFNRKVYVFETSPDPLVYVPTGFEIVEGTPFGGGVPELAASDDQEVFILSEETIPNATIRLDYTGVISNPTALDFDVEVSADRDDLSVFIEVLNTVTNAYVLQDSSTSTIADSIRSFTIAANAANYVTGTGDLKVRIRWIPQQDLEAADGWSEQVDSAFVAAQ